MTDAQIITGDALELIPTLADGSVDLVVTSPPYPGQYGNGMISAEWVEWYELWASRLWRKLSPTGVVVINVMFKRGYDGWFDRRLFDVADGPFHWRFNLLDLYIYGKANPPPNGALTYCDPPGFEFIYVFTKAARPQDVTFNPVRRPYAPKSINGNGHLYSNMSARQTAPHPDGARQSTLMLMSKSADQNRPSAKGISFPRALPDRFIRQYTNPGDLVLDPFAGVGTTVRVAAELGRRAIGFEIDADEAERAREWLAKPVQAELFAANGATP